MSTDQVQIKRDVAATASTSTIHRVLDTRDLVATILSFLKDQVIQDSSKNQPAGAVVKWKYHFASLARVNRTFCGFCLDVIWREMDSIGPFFSLLRDPVKQEQPYLPGVSDECWDRFNFYALRARTLNTWGSGALSIPPAWLLYLTMSRGRPEPFFPLLQELSLTSEDQFSLFVALSTCTIVRTLRVNINNTQDPATEAGVVELTANLRRTSTGLRTLYLMHPVNQQMIANISKISSILFLSIIVPIGLSTQLKSLVNTKAQVLSLQLASVRGQSANQHPTPQDLNRLSLCNTNPDLRTLEILGELNTQYDVFPVVCPRQLTKLILKFFCWGDYRQRRCAPFVAAVHIRRNPSLWTLSILSLIQPGWEALYKDEPATVNWDRPFLSALSTLLRLSELTVVDASFNSTTITEDLLEAVESLPRLTKLHFLPREDHPFFIYPTFPKLRDIAERHLYLQELSIFMDCDVLPNPRDQSLTPSHGLRSIALHFRGSIQAPYPLDHALSTSRYLDRLFPQLKSTTRNLTSGLTMSAASFQISRGYWGNVERMVLSHQAVRADTIRDLQKHGR